MPEQQQTLTTEQAIDLAVRHHNGGRLSQAENIYQQILRKDADQPVALHLLGVISHQMGKHDIAINLITRALALNPDLPAAHNNLGVAFYELGKPLDATACYRKALTLNPDHAEAHNNLGVSLKELGRLKDAVVSYHRALALKADFVEAHYNLGLTLNKFGKLEEAIVSFKKAIDFKPDYLEAWNDLKFTVKALWSSKGQKSRKADLYKQGFNDEVRASANFAMLEYYLDSFRPHEAEESFRKATAALPSEIDEEMAVSGTANLSGTPPPFADKLVALLHFGRSGTGLLHSLIDSHPEVSTLPSIYLRGFFNADVWNKISAKGWRRLPEQFADEFAVLFDANVPKPTPGRLGENSVGLGQKEGMTSVGESRNESLSLDRDRFCAEAVRLMTPYKKVDPKLFLLIVHAAFEKVLGTKTKKHTVFYHLHNPDDFSTLNFLRYDPDARLIMMVREPIQSCESWVHDLFRDNEYENVVQRIISMLFAVDQIAFRMRDSVGIRLEDLKTKPEATLRSLCTWLGIKETPSLYQMTAQGKKWWGDPASPDYDANKAMVPFDKASIQRPVGSIFSEKDRLILETLFYPFSVRFGYRESDPAAFEKDLKAIRPLFDELLDFEKVMSERSEIDPTQFKRSEAYLLLRASLIDRWDVLNEFKDYPHLLSPLEIMTD